MHHKGKVHGPTSVSAFAAQTRRASHRWVPASGGGVEPDYDLRIDYAVVGGSMAGKDPRLRAARRPDGEGYHEAQKFGKLSQAPPVRSSKLSCADMQSAADLESRASGGLRRAGNPGSQTLSRPRPRHRGRLREEGLGGPGLPEPPPRGDDHTDKPEGLRSPRASRRAVRLRQTGPPGSPTARCSVGYSLQWVTST